MPSRSVWLPTLVFGVMALVLSGCGSLSGGLSSDTLALASGTTVATGPAAPDAGGPLATVEVESDPMLVQEPEGASGAEAASSAAEAQSVPVALAGPDGEDSSSLTDASPLSLIDTRLMAQTGDTPSGARSAVDEPVEEYDPLEKFNEAMFTFNLNVDRYVIRPVAKAYNFVMPDEIQRMISRAFANINFVPRMVNSLLQGKFAGAGRELARFLINTVAGIGGFWDIAKQELNIEPSKADFGQTLGKWGTPPGPYLILPFLPPLTFRDGIGYAVDGAMDPLSYVLPFIWERLVMKVIDTINDRSLNLDLFQGFEETTVDFYSAVRNGYLQRRYRLINED